MSRIFRMLGFAIVGAIGLGVVAFFSGFLAARVTGDDEGLAMLTVFYVIPAAIVLGGVAGGYWGWRTAQSKGA